jgi:Golgi nucleoside diphosphatase
MNELETNSNANNLEMNFNASSLMNVLFDGFCYVLGEHQCYNFGNSNFLLRLQEQYGVKSCAKGTSY